MEREQTTIRLPVDIAEVKSFVTLLKGFDEKEQLGLNLMLEGLQLLANKKSG